MSENTPEPPAAASAAAAPTAATGVLAPTAAERRRAGQTAVNLIIALCATLAVVAFLVIVVVRPDQASSMRGVDWRAEATAASSDGHLMLAPDLPEGWSANRASLSTVAGIATWSIGFLTPAGKYVALEQGFDANEDWVRASAAIESVRVLDSAQRVEIAGRQWSVVDRRGQRDAPGNHPLVLVSKAGNATVVLHGTADEKDIRFLVAALEAQLLELDHEGNRT